MISAKILSLFLIIPYKSNMIILYNEENIPQIKRVTEGNDERYNSTNDNDPSLLNKIEKHTRNKNILDLLNNNQTSIQKKINIIDFYLKDYNFSTSSKTSIAGFDIAGGNLFNEFNTSLDNNNITEVF